MHTLDSYDYNTYVLGPPEGNTGDARDLLQSKTKESLPSLTLGTGLDLVESGLGGGILLKLVLGVVRGDFFDGGRHLYETRIEMVVSAGASYIQSETSQSIIVRSTTTLSTGLSWFYGS